MSRRDFRSTVEAPRPAAAWAMVTVAGATLWITQQLDPWAVGAQAAALLLSLWRRTEPFPWQQSPLVLNLGMIAIVAGTIVVALRGEPSTIALAHFAATTQGLQLLDARPRRTEFLLVALALFQVVLAANLTDSVFFPPLLVAFLFATVWTLLVHTLRSEALEAGVAHEVPRALTPGLVRMTALACLVAIAIGLVLFVTLPRLRTSVLRGAQAGPSLATAGFSDKVAFGTLGRIRQDPRVVLRVETLEGASPPPEQAYWRGLAFDTFDGTSWSVTPPERVPVPGSAEGGVGLSRRADDYNLVQRIVREPVTAGVLFAVGSPRALQGTVRRLERDWSGGLYAAGQADERVRYTIRSMRRAWNDDVLRADEAVVPRRDGARYLRLPRLSDAFLARALEIAGDQPTDADRARAIERTLIREGRYTDDPPAPDPEARTSPVEAFLLGDVEGHCEYFASAMVLVARANGLPARLVNGFAGGRENRIGGFVEVSRSDAHAWVEIHYERAGWVRYDPTPADLRARADAPPSLAARLRELGSAAELWWFQRVVGFDRADQIGALRRAWVAWKRAGHGRPGRDAAPPKPRRLRLDGPWREAAWLVLCAAAGGGMLRLAFRRRRRRDAVPPAYAKALRLLARRGLVRAPSTTARCFAREVRARCAPPVVEAFDALTERYLAERFGGRTAGAADLELSRLRRALRARS